MRIVLLTLTLLFGQLLHGQTYFLQGDATFLGDDCYRLTTELGFQNGAVWYSNQIDLSEPFNLEFLMNFGDIDANGADGICFVLQTVGNNALGQSGGGLGFLGFAPALGVEFDTWQNSDYGDPVPDHIGIVSNGDVNHNGINAIAGPVAAISDNPNIEDGEDHVVRIQWFPETTTLLVYFDCVFRLSATVDLINDIFNGQNQVFWGFTAATGGSFNNQTVCLSENILESSYTEEICAGGSAQLIASGDPDGEFTWEPSMYLDDPTSANPICTPEEEITYTVTANGLCGVPEITTITVELDTLEAEVSGTTFLNCNTPVGSLEGSTNFGELEDWLWSTGDGNIVSGAGSNSIVIDGAGTYTAEVTYNNQCTSIIDFEVEGDFEGPEVAIEGNNTLTCEDTELTLTADSDTNGITYSWGNDQGSEISIDDAITVSETGTYTLLVVNPENGCGGTASINVNADLVGPDVFAGLPDSLSCQTPFLEIEGAEVSPANSTLSWSTDFGAIADGANTLSPTITSPGVYTLTALNPDNGCTSTSQVTIGQDETATLDISGLVIPNVFTPNADGINDNFLPLLSNDPTFNLTPLFSKYDLKIYNRWGSLIFESNGSPIPWNGRDNGNELSAGVYYYVLDVAISCGTTVQKTLTGTIELLK